LQPAACNYEGKVFVGAYLGSTDVVYRDEVRQFSSFNDYQMAQLLPLVRIKKAFDQKQDNAVLELEKFKKIIFDGKIPADVKKVAKKSVPTKDVKEKYDVLMNLFVIDDRIKEGDEEQEKDFHGKPRIFTFANDCSCCS
jgi:hypothetical protein